MEKPTMNLNNIGNGALAELFDKQLQEVLKNIQDPNSDVKKKSTITIQVGITPFENRDAATMDYSVTSKQAPPKVRQTSIMFGEEEGVFIANEIGKQAPGQTAMHIVAKNDEKTNGGKE